MTLEIAMTSWNRSGSAWNVSDRGSIAYGSHWTVSGERAGISAVQTRSKKKSDARVKRRLRGFLVEIEGNEAHVCFVEGKDAIAYDLPAEQLRKAGITLRNQPFEMDEVEIEDATGNLIFGYTFRALADANDAYIEPLQIDPKTRRETTINH